MHLSYFPPGWLIESINGNDCLLFVNRVANASEESDPEISLSLPLSPPSFPASLQTCNPEAAAPSQWISTRHMLIGCWTSFVQDDAVEVHILKVTANTVSQGQGYTNEVASRPQHLRKG